MGRNCHVRFLGQSSRVLLYLPRLPTVLTREAPANRSGHQRAPSAGAGQLLATRRFWTGLGSASWGRPARAVRVRRRSGRGPLARAPGTRPHPRPAPLAALLPAFCHRYRLFFKLPSRQPRRQQGESRPTLTQAPPAGPPSTSHKDSLKESGPACSVVDLRLDCEADVRRVRPPHRGPRGVSRLARPFPRRDVQLSSSVPARLAVGSGLVLEGARLSLLSENCHFPGGLF